MGAPTPSVRSPGGPRRAGELNGRDEALGEASNMQQAGSQPSIFLPFPTSRTWSYAATSGTFSKTPGGAWTHTGARTRGLTRITQREPHYLRTIKPTRRTPNIFAPHCTSSRRHERTLRPLDYSTATTAPHAQHMHPAATSRPGAKYPARRALRFLRNIKLL